MRKGSVQECQLTQGRLTCRLCRLKIPCGQLYQLEFLGNGNRTAVVCVACLMKVLRRAERARANV